VSRGLTRHIPVARPSGALRASRYVDSALYRFAVHARSKAQGAPSMVRPLGGTAIHWMAFYFASPMRLTRWAPCRRPVLFSANGSGETLESYALRHFRT